MDYLIHYGVLGMKWGRRKKSSNVETYHLRSKSGEKLTLTRDKTPLITKAISKVNKNIAEEVQKSKHYTLRNSEGKRAGSFQLYSKNKEEMNMTWAQVNKKYQNKGYMSSMMDSGEKIARKYGHTKLTGEVIGSSPNMLHITKKKGYKVTGTDKSKDMMDIWGGLTFVEKKLKK